MRRRLTAILLAAGMLLLTACAGLPLSGDVYPGREATGVADEPDLSFVPDRPQPGATPDQIVNGFVRAGVGTQDDWAIAKLYLAPGTAWNPRASVTIDRLADRTAPTEGTTGVVTMEVSPTGLVDESGAYREQSGAPTPLGFELAQQDDGEWRITRAPDGILLFEEQFRAVFQEAALAYFDPSFEFLVPDVRWYPRTNIATYVAGALVDGAPSPWLAGAVINAFPPDVVLASGAVPEIDGVAQVELGEDALTLPQTTLGRMQTQIEATMRSAGVGAVQLTVDGSPLEAPAAVVRSTRVDTASLVQLDTGAFGFLEGGDVESVSELSAAVESLPGVVSVEAGPELAYAAVLTDQGVVARAGADGTTAQVDTRGGLVPPSIDPGGAIWSVPGDQPTAQWVVPVEGDPIEVEGAWPEAGRISAIAVSRDGTRIAAVVGVRGHSELWVAAIRRGSDGARVALGEHQVLAEAEGEGLDVAWLDDTTVGMLVRRQGEVSLREQTVGGPGVDYTVPGGVGTLVGGNSSPRLLTDVGVLYVRQATNWQQIAEDVRVLAGQQGMP